MSIRFLETLRVNLNKIHEWQMKLALIILWFYLWILFSLQLISRDVRMSIWLWIFLCIFSFMSAFLIMQILPKTLVHIKVARNNKHSYVIGIMVAAITFLIFEMYLAGQYPGGMSPDTVEQYSQAMGEQPYNDWHPVLHTLLFFTLPLKTGHRLGFIVFMQLLYFSIAFGYLIYVMHRNKCPIFFWGLICVYIWINPFMATYMMYPVVSSNL